MLMLGAARWKKLTPYRGELTRLRSVLAVPYQGWLLSR